MREYDLVLVLKTALSEKEREKEIKTIKDWLQDIKVVSEEAMGQKPLAYRIKKELAGFYHKIVLQASSIPADFEKKMVNNENVLRHLLLRTK